jgi:hypothetical protein
MDTDRDMDMGMRWAGDTDTDPDTNRVSNADWDTNNETYCMSMVNEVLQVRQYQPKNQRTTVCINISRVKEIKPKNNMILKSYF